MHFGLLVPIVRISFYESGDNQAFEAWEDEKINLETNNFLELLKNT